MNFEWQLLITHSFSFLITLWILKRYAWGPLLGLIDERREKIVGEFETIEREKEKAEALNAEYAAKLREIDSERRAKIVEAVNEGKKIAEEIQASARNEAQEIRRKSKSELERELAKAKVQLKNDMVSLALAATEKLLREKLEEAQHRKLIGDYIDELEKA